jgi:hypothetical protein
MSFWGSYESVSWWSSFLTWSGISAAVIAAILGFIAHVFSNRATALKDEITESRIATAESQAEQVSDQLQPRTLTSEQKQYLLRELAKVADGSIEIEAVLGDPEAVNLANDFEAIFEGAGWQIPTGVRQAVFANPQEGVILVYNETASAQINQVRGAIEAVGFPVEEVKDEGANAIRLIIGVKPTP